MSPVPKEQSYVKTIAKENIPKVLQFSVALCAALTSFYFTYLLINGHINQGLITSVIVTQNETLKFPNPTVCMEFTASSLDFGEVIDVFNTSEIQEMLKFHEKDIIYLFGLLSDKIDSKSTLNQQRQYLDTYDTEKKPILMPILYLLTNIITAMVSVETNMNSKIYKKYEWLNNVEKLVPTESLIQAYKFFINNRMSFEDLLRSTGMYLCILNDMHFEVKTGVSRKSVNSNFNICRKSTVTWLGPMFSETHGQRNDLLCIRPQEEADMLKFNSTLVSTHFSIRQRLTNTKAKNSLNQHLIYFDFKRDPTFINSKNTIITTVNSKHLVKLGIETEYNRESSESHPCSDIFYCDCLFACIGTNIRKKCGCQPLFLQFSTCLNEMSKLRHLRKKTTPDSCQTCDISSLSSAQCFSSNLKEHGFCKSSCLKSCFQQILSFSEETSELSGNLLHVIFSPSKFAYLVMKQQQVTSESELLAHLGGSMCLFLLIVAGLSKSMQKIFGCIFKEKVLNKVGPEMRDMMVTTVELQQKINMQSQQLEEIEKTKSSMKSIAEQFMTNKMTIWAQIAKVDKELKAVKEDLEQFKKKSWGQLASLQNNVEFHMASRSDANRTARKNSQDPST